MTELAQIKLYTAEELANFLGIALWTANKLCRERRIKAIKIGKEWRVTQNALEEYLKIRR